MLQWLQGLKKKKTNTFFTQCLRVKVRNPLMIINNNKPGTKGQCLHASTAAHKAY